jgi:hypothetical protein
VYFSLFMKLGNLKKWVKSYIILITNPSFVSYFFSFDLNRSRSSSISFIYFLDKYK